ncbi:MAG TPA: class II aldolase/adducin family protein [Bryobacteraceae bacterium]|nr:class II aldolase/adducin family protein [Bryobacteraceae bacterium]
MKSFDLTQFRVITLEDVQNAVKAGANELQVQSRAILTPSAKDLVTAKGLAVKGGCCDDCGPGTCSTGGGSSTAFSSNEWDKILNSPEAEKIKQEIVDVGRKLWMRQYVDGNGGNISYRIAENAVICTPTLTSKADLKTSDMCLVDLDGKQLAGSAARTSEILLHLEIYKAVPEAKACVHCHPAHATAYAITGRVPITCVIPEFEVFVGKVALSPYETPGTKKFAETVIPYVKKHNTVLLANHGIICWGDTVTHAEWYVEVTDTYCWTLMLANQLGSPITHITGEKSDDLLALKKKLNLPDARHDTLQECALCDLPEFPGGIAVVPGPVSGGPASNGASSNEVEAIVKSVTDSVMAALNKKS